MAEEKELTEEAKKQRRKREKAAAKEDLEHYLEGLSLEATPSRARNTEHAAISDFQRGARRHCRHPHTLPDAVRRSSTPALPGADPLRITSYRRHALSHWQPRPR